MKTKSTTSEQIKVRACSIVCTDHPEWGTWGVMEDKGDYFEIHGQSGSRVLFKSEADEFWTVVPVKRTRTIKRKPKPYDVTGNIIAFESGELEQHEVIELFQHLVNTGLAWSLQGSYGRMAHALIQAGEISQ